MDLARLQLTAVTAPSHTQKVFNPARFPELVDRLAEKVQQLMLQFPEIEALAAIGNSGCPLVGALCYKLKMPMIVVRKSLNLDVEHDHRMVNGYTDVKGYLLIDDLVASGKTLRHVYKEIRRVSNARFYGALLYEAGYAEGGVQYDEMLNAVYALWNVSGSFNESGNYCPGLKRKLTVNDIGPIDASLMKERTTMTIPFRVTVGFSDGRLPDIDKDPSKDLPRGMYGPLRPRKTVALMYLAKDVARNIESYSPCPAASKEPKECPVCEVTTASTEPVCDPKGMKDWLPRPAPFLRRKFESSRMENYYRNQRRFSR